jgi:hypothetical protein
MRRIFPIVVLFLLSPFIAEIIFGGTPLSNIGAFLLDAPLYGAGALLIRDVVRRRGGGWGQIALLAAAYAIVEGGIALGSLFNYNLFNAGLYGGRAFGINWVWSEWTIGYHIIWSISTPVLLAELLFPDHRDEPWLGRVGNAIAGVLYLLGAVGLGLIFRNFVAPEFQMPLPALIGSLVAIVALVAVAWVWKPTPAAPANAPQRAAPPP